MLKQPKDDINCYNVLCVSGLGRIFEVTLIIAIIYLARYVPFICYFQTP